MGLCTVAGAGETSTDTEASQGLMSGAVLMHRPEKRAGLVMGTGKRSHMERLSLVAGCSQPTPKWLGKNQENKYPY